MKKILLIDNDKALCESLSGTLEANGYAVTCAHSAVEGRRLALALAPDAIVTEAMLETDNAGFELVYQIRDDRPDSRYAAIRDTPILLLTAIDQLTHFRFSLNEKQSYLPPISGMLSKPAQIDTLLSKLKDMVG
ncbi:response regulator transcription factor [Chitiniphilus shinanonensis]|uniref:response regulator transcription factor n=1 Tax=Chitiniphilus shinanonensis TaxID=553088 RepID=UPI0030298153